MRTLPLPCHMMRIALVFLFLCVGASQAQLEFRSNLGNTTTAHINLTYFGTNNPRCEGDVGTKPSYMLALDLDTCYPIPDLTFFCSDAGQCFYYKRLKSITKSQALFGRKFAVNLILLAVFCDNPKCVQDRITGRLCYNQVFKKGA